MLHKEATSLSRVPIPWIGKVASSNLAGPMFQRFDMCFVYIIESTVKPRFYVGICADLEIRLSQHNSGKNLSTKAYRPWRLAWQQTCPDRSNATLLERKIKSWKSRLAIQRLISQNTPL
jgi:putative endonuclease